MGEPANENSDNCARLRAFLLDNVDRMRLVGGSGTDPKIPKFDLYTQDYLAFAEGELDAFLLNRRSHKHLINCVAHLKRAMDCQLDTFLHVFNLLKVFRERNLKFEKKLDFLETIGVFTSRSLERLNKVRNRMEHNFSVPDVKDIEVYFDLVSAFVAVLQRAIASTLRSSQDYGILRSGEREGVFTIEYEFGEPALKVAWRLSDDKHEMRAALSNSVTDFAFFFRAWLTLCLLETFASSRYVVAHLAGGAPVGPGNQ